MKITFDLGGARTAWETIWETYVYAVLGFLRSQTERNIERMNYWLERVNHLYNELNWITEILRPLEGGRIESDEPPRYILENGITQNDNTRRS